MKRFLKRVLPKNVYRLLRDWQRRRLEKRYLAQRLTRIRCGFFEIDAPASHSLVELAGVQPYRDLCVGISAKCISAKYPDGTMLDIGANIGDTAAWMATYARNRLILVEGSDYFFDILTRNVAQMPNEIVLTKAFVSDGQDVTGSFYYRSGTASFDEDATQSVEIKTRRLSSIGGENCCFVKTDTDGYDFKILLDSLDWLASEHPAILFENQIESDGDCALADELYAGLTRIGYSYFILWDDPGFHLLSTRSTDVLRDLNRYVLKVLRNGGHRSIYYYDVLALHEDDADVYEEVREWFRTY
jgi:FkbM family methyltransferase